MIFESETYYGVCLAMGILAPVVFIALQFISAGYGMMYTRRWGPSVSNRLGWVLMEAPSFFGMLLLWALSPRRGEFVPGLMATLFLIHYFQRSFIFPLLMRGRNRMPLSIAAMGIIFNLVNSYLIGGWLFYVSPAGTYPLSWLHSPQFIIGVLLFVAGAAVNMHSDHLIRNLRKPGDTRHYIPRGGMYRYVSSANYFGEFVEWAGYAILTWSVGGAVFALWTFANLAPRARRIHRRYLDEFGEEYRSLKRKYIIPFIY